MEEKRKVLFVATEDQGHIMKFHLPYLKEFKKAGFEVHVACGGDQTIPYCDHKIAIPFRREPVRIQNLIAYRKLKRAIESESYEIIHCHTPVGGVLGRMAARGARKKGTKVMYTAHGFHFFRGASRLAWLIYYPVEKYLSRWTDCLITINREDYGLVNEKGFYARHLVYVHGVGVDLNHFHSVGRDEKMKLRKELGIRKDAFVMMLAGDYNKNKNQEVLLHVVKALKEEIPWIQLILVGEGVLEEKYRSMVRSMGLEEHVQILGFRRDVSKLLQASDLAVSVSYREGLPVFLMEAMATGLPIVATNCRGNRDLVVNGKNGTVVEINDLEEYVDAVRRLAGSEEERKSMGLKARELVRIYDLKEVFAEMRDVYGACLSE